MMMVPFASFLLLAAPALTAQGASPAQVRISWARGLVEKAPERPRGYTQLAMALARRARETGEPAFYSEAEAAVEKALTLAPDDFEARKARVWLRLGHHDFARAREEARELNRIAPDDVQVYGLLADASAELGDYAEAERAAQWMLDLRPGNVPGLTRAAYLRELFGDLDGALELMAAAYAQTPVSESEERAWLLTQIGHLHLVQGAPEVAEAHVRQALAVFPGYHYALAGLAKVRGTQGRHAEAVDLLRQRYQAAPHPENLYDLARALQRAGRRDEARAAWLRFEREARAEAGNVDNANRELALYYADQARRPAAALEIARRERERRHDVRTLGVYAWALFVSGRRGEAQKVLREALAVGTRDPEIVSHARTVLGDQAARAW
jgi:tetratricopeptide (TPR) repeat protein